MDPFFPLGTLTTNIKQSEEKKIVNDKLNFFLNFLFRFT